MASLSIRSTNVSRETQIFPVFSEIICDPRDFERRRTSYHNSCCRTISTLHPSRGLVGEARARRRDRPRLRAGINYARRQSVGAATAGSRRRVWTCVGCWRMRNGRRKRNPAGRRFAQMTLGLFAVTFAYSAAVFPPSRSTRDTPEPVRRGEHPRGHR